MVSTPADIANKHSYSLRLVKPFVALLMDYPGFPSEVLQPLNDMELEDRLPVAALLELMRGAILLTGDEDLGLKAAQKIERGDMGALEYAAASADTGKRAMEITARYLVLVNDALRFSMTIEQDRAVVELHSVVPLSRAAVDFQSAAFVRATTFVMGIPAPEVDGEAWFEHAAPANLEVYTKAFPGLRLRFGMPFNGFAFDATALAAPLPSADPKLHQLIREHADGLLRRMGTAGSFAHAVRDLLIKELPGGNPNALRIASLMNTSPRTLSRRLADEGTTFKDLLDELRHNLALFYVGMTSHGFSAVALLLGYTDAAAFHRAFKRWTGHTPGEYRREALLCKRGQSSSES